MDDISSHLVNTLSGKFMVRASDVDGLTRFISMMLEKSAIESATTTQMKAERELTHREEKRRKRKENKRTRPLKALSPRAREKQLKREHKESLKK